MRDVSGQTLRAPIRMEAVWTRGVNSLQQLECRYKERMKGHHDALGPLRTLPKERTTLGNVWNSSLLSDLSACVYVHVPFCSRLCRFCNLRRQVSDPPQDYVQTILSQMGSFSHLPSVENMRINAVYFGGGTPTVLSPSDLGMILNGLKEAFVVEVGAEVTVETSLSDLTDEHLDMFEIEGVNRISLGVQTFTNRGRRLLGRKGCGQDITHRIEQILNRGFDNVSLDLIYNYPGQTLDELTYDLHCITDLNISGLSLYPLMLHEGSMIFREIEEERLKPPLGVEVERSFYEKIYAHLRMHGFEILELTKMVRPGRDQYQYIRTRYSGGSTLAFGAGAAGKLGRFAYHNPLAVDEYRAQLDKPIRDLQGLCRSGFEENVYKMIGLVQMGRFPQEHVWPEAEPWLAPLRKSLLGEGLLQEGANGLTLSRTGLFWGNNIAREIAMTAASQNYGE